MSTPPEQPYGQRPGEYGEQGGDPYPGGFPQHGGQGQHPYGEPGYGQGYGNVPYDPDAQHPQYSGPRYQQPQYQQPQHQQPQYPYAQSPYPQQSYWPQGETHGFGSQPPPPKKSRTGLWVGLAAGSAALVAFLVTALIAPGFLITDDDGSAAGATGRSDPGQGAPGQSGRATIERFVSAINGAEPGTMINLMCQRYRGELRDFIETAQVRSQALQVSIDKFTQLSDERVKADLTGTFNAESVSGTIGAQRGASGDYCVAVVDFT